MAGTGNGDDRRVYSLDRGWKFLLDSNGTSKHSSQSNATCASPWCLPTFEDGSWRSVNVPHDFVVEGTFSQSADMAHGYLPYGIGLYRKRVAAPSSDEEAQMLAAGSLTAILVFDGVQRDSDVSI